MKIGIITFHWATNYGAVIQAYALQQYLKNKGYKTEIIDYVPRTIKFKQRLSNIKHANVKNIIKEYKISQFRKSELILSFKKYYNNSELLKSCDEYDAYICGSDQVWNEWFTISSEDKPNLSYYLNFVNSSKKRVSYATSFGTGDLSSKVKKIVKPELEKFSGISVRENSGKNIMKDMELDATLVLDPTLLLEKEAYEQLIKGKNMKNTYHLFSYILHDGQIIADKINEYVFNTYFNKNIDKRYNKKPISIYEWLYNVKNSRFILTNSFHGAVFSIIFHKPFMVIPVQATKMNDRIKTLLNSVGLENRIIYEFDEKMIDEVVKETIDWSDVDSKLQKLKTNSLEFLEKSLEI